MKLKMVSTVGLFFFAVSAFGQGTSGAKPAEMTETAAHPADEASHGSCVILKRMGPADQVTSHMYSFGIRGKQFQYVEGELPPGTKFHGRLTDHDVRGIQEHGGRVVIMEPKYSADDLREAKQSKAARINRQFQSACGGWRAL